MLDFVRLDFLPLRFVGVFSILLDLWHGVSPYHHQWKIRVCGGDFRRISSWIAKIKEEAQATGQETWLEFSTGDKDLDARVSQSPPVDSISFFEQTILATLNGRGWAKPHNGLAIIWFKFAFGENRT
ncbi:hypothetical protein DVH24_018528 [Malus domestica]|uniref:Uncharacterized protein n=1 Tax=Malus domestica TaxID=3750 RepID=A0A498KGI6_MALDO|nr:hypothetical protein DVH24_018528 [Malus domestica]